MITIKKRKPEFILVFLGGLIMVAQGLTFFAALQIGLPHDDMLESIRSSIGNERFNYLLIRAGIAGVSTGAMLILLSILIERSEESRRFGVMAIIIGIVSILGIGFISIGTLPGIILAIVGGILAAKKGKGSIFADKEQKTYDYTTALHKDENIIYQCSRCNIEFASDEELKRHVIRFHSDEIVG